MSRNLVVKDNALINASYNLELIEQRLILLAITQARRAGLKLNSDTKIEISVSDYLNVYSVQGRSVYDNIRNACKTLFERQFTYVEKAKTGLRVATSRWVSEIAYIDEIGIVDLIFAPSVVPLITMLEKHFTSYELEQVAELNSKYAIRLYEILIAWRVKGSMPKISINELRERLGVFKNEYPLVADFKKWVLNASITQINNKTNIIVNYEQHKQGRKIVGFTFSFKEKIKKGSEFNLNKFIKESKETKQYKQEKIKETQRSLINYFENLELNHQENILNEVEKRINNKINLALFKRKRQENTAHKSKIFMALFKEILNY